MKRFLALLLLVLTLNVHAQKVNWPNHKKAVIILTYDDGLDSQLKNAVPQLEAANLTATFFLIGDINSDNIPKWRALSTKGYELGNHTLYHPCLVTDDNPVHSEGYTPKTMVNEIEIMNNFLFAVDGKTSRTYAYPCTETVAGGKDYVNTLRKSDLIKYARVGGDVDAVITDFKNLDLLRVPAYGVDENTPASKLIAFVQLVQKSGGMGIFMFHGIGGDYITTSIKAHQELLNYLKKNANVLWVPTFQQGMDYATNAVKTTRAK